MKRSRSSSIKRTQFPVALTQGSTKFMVQNLSLDQGAVYFDLQKRKSSGLGQIHTVLYRIATYDKLFYRGEYKISSIKINVEALGKYE